MRENTHNLKTSFVLPFKFFENIGRQGCEKKTICGRVKVREMIGWVMGEKANKKEEV